MAVNVSVFDLENFPNNPKTVTVDLTELVPYGNQGEDTWVLSAITTATASGGAAIQRLYVSNTKWGWAKSSGLKQGSYSVTSGQRHLKVAIDEDISGAVEVSLDTSILALTGDAVAKDLQTKINNTASPGAAKAKNLSYLNAVVNFDNGVFEIISGTASSTYTGSSRSSVDVADGTTTAGLAEELGFNIIITSEALASAQIKQTSLAANYTSGTSITVGTTGLISSGDCLVITDGTNKEFRGVENAVGAGVTLASGLANTYSAGSLVQVLELQDSAAGPPLIYDNVDDFIKYAIASISNQINFGP